jgi:hypothetical protein
VIHLGVAYEEHLDRALQILESSLVECARDPEFGP